MSEQVQVYCFDCGWKLVAQFRYRGSRKVGATFYGPVVDDYGKSVDGEGLTPLQVCSLTSCGSNWASVMVDADWNSESLHNGAELDIMFSVQRSDGQHFLIGTLLQITQAKPWPGHPAFGGRYQTNVPTPAGMYLKYATVTSWMVNSGVRYPPNANDTVQLKQSTRNC